MNVNDIESYENHESFQIEIIEKKVLQCDVIVTNILDRLRVSNRFAKVTFYKKK